MTFIYTDQDMSSHSCLANSDNSDDCIHHKTRKSSQSIPLMSSSPKSSPMKPMRPLTAYHIFFQIEREYIIQTTAGSDADPSIHDHKFYLSDVPRRYANIKLSTDWYAGPGKRAKRKHRKSHGKIGFLELSRVVSARWANLGQVDPETKAFVAGIAKRELDQYKREMKEYEALVKGMHGDTQETAVETKVSKTVAPKKVTRRTAKKSAPPLPSLPSVTADPEPVSSSTHEQHHYHLSLVTPPTTPPPTELFFQSEFDITDVFNEVSPDSTFSSDNISIESSENMSLPHQEPVDYSISYVDNAGHHIPSPSSSVCGDRKRSISEEESICDPLFELEASVDVTDVIESPFVKKRRMSVGAFGFDGDFCGLWSQ